MKHTQIIKTIGDIVASLPTALLGGKVAAVSFLASHNGDAKVAIHVELPDGRAALCHDFRPENLWDDRAFWCLFGPVKAEKAERDLIASGNAAVSILKPFQS